MENKTDIFDLSDKNDFICLTQIHFRTPQINGHYVDYEICVAKDVILQKNKIIFVEDGHRTIGKEPEDIYYFMVSVEVGKDHYSFNIMPNDTIGHTLIEFNKYLNK